MKPIRDRWAPVALAAALCVPAVAITAVYAQEQQEQQDREAKPAREPTNHRALREWFPAELQGLKRTSTNSQRFAHGEMRMTTADATYNDPDNRKSVSITLMDYTAQEEMARAAAYWTEMEIDNETDTSYQRSVKVEGYPALESYDSESKNGSLHVIIEERVLVQLDADGLSGEEFSKMRDNLGLKKLGEVVKQGGAPTTRPAEQGQGQDQR